MSETSTLISCTGKITRAELAQLPTPPSTATHVPVPHAAVVEALVDTLSHGEISVVDEEFALSKDGMEMFGVLGLPVTTRCPSVSANMPEAIPRSTGSRMEDIRQFGNVSRA